MSNRAARRESERRARELAYRAAKASTANTTSPETPTPKPISETQLAANRANAEHSCGPKTTAGKAISSLNAVKTALTGRTVLLPSDDAEEYRAHILAHQERFKPVGRFESDLVQSIADAAWRLRRISSLEFALYAKGRSEFADQFKDIADPRERAAFIDLHTTQTYAKDFRNLALQESRLTRYRTKDMAELQALQQERIAKHEAELEQATALYKAANESGLAWAANENGFVFSTAKIERPIASQPSSEKEQVAEQHLEAAA